MKEEIKYIIDPEILESVQSVILKFCEISEDGFIKLAALGWYIDGEFTFADSIAFMQEARNDEKESIDNHLIEYYNSSLKEKADRISKTHKERSLIISEAVKCHIEEKYYASTTLFLSQADGICSGLLFRTRNDKEALKKDIAKNNKNRFISVLMSAIENKSPIDNLYSELNKSEGQLNRHGVMHGWDTEFGTKTNSLKAFSIMCFVSDFVGRYKKQKPTMAPFYWAQRKNKN